MSPQTLNFLTFPSASRVALFTSSRGSFYQCPIDEASCADRVDTSLINNSVLVSWPPIDRRDKERLRGRGFLKGNRNRSINFSRGRVLVFVAHRLSISYVLFNSAGSSQNDTSGTPETRQHQSSDVGESETFLSEDEMLHRHPPSTFWASVSF